MSFFKILFTLNERFGWSWTKRKLIWIGKFLEWVVILKTIRKNNSVFNKENKQTNYILISWNLK
jgi:hypothetical protein